MSSALRTALHTSFAVLIAFACSASLPSAQSSAGVNVASIIERSVATNTVDWKAQPQYSYRVLTMKAKGGVGAKVDQSRTFEVLMVEGSPYERLVGINGHPLGPAQERQEHDKLAREIRSRQNESPADRGARVSKYRSSRAEEHLLMQQMVGAFNFSFIDEESVDGVDCYVFEAKPKSDYQPPVEKARVLTGMRGKLWIDKSQYHWVKVEAEVIHPVEFGFFVAQVKPGTQFELEQGPVGSVWLPKHFSQSVNATVFGLYGMHNREESLYSDYQLPSVAARNEVPVSYSRSVPISDSGRGGSPAR